MSLFEQAAAAAREAGREVTDLTFHDPHEYRIDGRPVPSVTQVLGDVLPGWQADEWYLQRGTAVHACAAMIARGQEFDHDPAIDGQVEACRRFFREVRPVTIAVEQRVYSRRHGYAGTMDLLCTIRDRVCLLDWKASLAPATRYQVAGYALAWAEMGAARTGATRGLSVALLDTGYYAMSDVWDVRRDAAGWLALLAAYRIRRECGIKEGGE